MASIKEIVPKALRALSPKIQQVSIDMLYQCAHPPCGGENEQSGQRVIWEEAAGQNLANLLLSSKQIILTRSGYLGKTPFYRFRLN